MAKELEILFNSKARPKILQLFFQNEDYLFSSKDVTRRCQINSNIARSELEKLRKINLLERKKQKKKPFYILNNKFSFFNELKAMIQSAPIMSLREIKKTFEKIPHIKLFLVSGTLLQEKKSPVDILVVGDGVSNSKVSRAIRKTESNTGKELQWSLMTEKEFEYRSQINDRFLKDILSHRHKKIIEKIKVK